MKRVEKITIILFVPAFIVFIPFCILYRDPGVTVRTHQLEGEFEKNWIELIKLPQNLIITMKILSLTSLISNENT